MVALGAGLLTMAQVAAMVPGRGSAAADRGTIRDWCVNGCRAADGEIVRLDHVRVGRRLMTTRPALDQFLARLTGPVATDTQPVGVRTSAPGHTHEETR